MGVGESYLWGKGEIEDMLFQPKNDHLLFAYFGISLQTRRRTLKTEIRARLSMKRKALRHLDPNFFVLIRDASDDRYPWLDEDLDKDRIARGRWKIMKYTDCLSDGVHLIHRRHFAFLDDNGEDWDCAEGMNDARPRSFDDPWREDDEDNFDARAEAKAVWDALPEKNRAWFEVRAVLPYENILDIDEQGDEWFGHPHIYTTEFRTTHGPFRSYSQELLEVPTNWGRRHGRASTSKRVQKFPRESTGGTKGNPSS